MRLAATTLIVVLTVGLIVTTGCTTARQFPDENPSIRGVITSLQRLRGGGTSLLVEGALEPDTEFEKASVRVPRDATIIAEDGTAKDASLLRTGLLVEIWFTGAVAESYPVQATAGKLVILGE